MGAGRSYCFLVRLRRGGLWSAPRTAPGESGAATLVNPLSSSPLFPAPAGQGRTKTSIKARFPDQPGFLFGSKATVRNYYLTKVHLTGFQKLIHQVLLKFLAWPFSIALHFWLIWPLWLRRNSKLSWLFKARQGRLVTRKRKEVVGQGTEDVPSFAKELRHWRFLAQGGYYALSSVLFPQLRPGLQSITLPTL